MAAAATSTLTPPSGSSFDSVIAPNQSQLDDVLASMRKHSDEAQERAGKVADSIETSRRALGALEPPKLQPLPEAPKPELRDPLTAFGSTASIVGMLASLLTRRPLTSALNAATGVMTAYRQQDLQQAKFQFDTFKAQMDNAKALHDWQMDTYKAALEKMETDQKGALAELQAYASAFKDENMLGLLQARSVSDIFKYVEASNAQWTKLQGILPKLEEYNTQMENYQRSLQEDPPKNAQDAAARYNRFFHPAGQAAADRVGDTPQHGGLTPAQDLAAAKRAYDTLYPLGIDRTTRTRADAAQLPDRTWAQWWEGQAKPKDAPIPTLDQFMKDDWPKVRERFMQDRAGGAAAPTTRTPTTVPAPGATSKPAAEPADGAAPSDFIPVPASLKDAKDGTVFQDTKGTYGKPNAYWIIRGGKAYPTQAPNADGSGSAAAGGRGEGEDLTGQQTRLPGSLLAEEDRQGLKPTDAELAQARRFMSNPPEWAKNDPSFQWAAGKHNDPSKVAMWLRTANIDVRNDPGFGRPAPMSAQAPSDATDILPPIAHETAGTHGLESPTIRSSPQGQALEAAQRGLDPKIAALLDERFPAKPGERSFADIGRSVNTLGVVNRDEERRFADTKADIKREHDRELKNTKLLEMAWNASPARRTEILRQLEGGFADATPSQKIEIVKLYIYDLSKRSGGSAADAAMR